MVASAGGGGNLMNSSVPPQTWDAAAAAAAGSQFPEEVVVPMGGEDSNLQILLQPDFRAQPLGLPEAEVHLQQPEVP